MTAPVALITGIGGQDGAYLSQLLLEKGYRVVGLERKPSPERFSILRALGIQDRLELFEVDVTDFEALHEVMSDTQPDEVYNLAAKTSVGLSFQTPLATYHSIATGTMNVLESVRQLDRPVRLLNANSSMLYGEMEKWADESTPFEAHSPYAVARISAFWGVSCYRDIMGLHACSAILFNHESPWRPPTFVPSKIVSAAVRIAQGSGERLKLGNLDVVRDWGWAEDYVVALWRMAQLDEPQDLIIATGQGRRLSEFVGKVFETVDLDWHDHVDVEPGLMRKGDPMVNVGNPAKAAEVIGWRASVGPDEVAERLVRAELKRQTRENSL